MNELMTVAILAGLVAMLAISAAILRRIHAPPAPITEQEREAAKRMHQQHVLHTAQRFERHEAKLRHIDERMRAAESSLRTAPDAEDMARIQNTLADLQASTSELHSQVAVVDERTKALMSGVARIQEHLMHKEHGP
jgi:hypothetical protein